jgi:predicted nucleic acid-binding protein
MQRVAVFDTNVLLSSRIAASVTCDEILTEFEEKLRLRFAYPQERAAWAVDEMRRLSRIVAVPNQLKVVSADPDDDKIIECALLGGATHVVTGDKRHLLPLKNYRGIEIVTPATFVAIVRSASTSP